MTDRPPQPPDPDRRRFFRQFAGEVVTSVGTVFGAAQALQQQSAEAARELLAAGEPAPAAPPPTPWPGSPPASGGAVPTNPELDASTAGYRAALRWDGGVCHLVDQRRLPDVIAELAIEGAADAVHAINDGSIIGAAVQAQLAAITLAIVAGRSRLARPFARRATVRGAANALRTTRPGSAAVAATIDRMLARQELLGGEVDGDTLVAALVDEAEAIVFEATSDHGAIVTNGLALLPGDADAPLRVLTAGSTGAMGGGQVGTALSVIVAAHHAGRPIHALVAETRPDLEGGRVAAWELGQAGVPYSVVTDAAAPGCIAAGEAALVLVTAERIAANGDVVAQAGTYPIALACREAGIPLLVLAATTAIDPAIATGAAADIEEGKPGPVLRAAGTRVAPEGSHVRNPVQDLTPAALVTALVTEEGVARAPFGPAIAGAVASAAARRSSSPGFARLLARRAEMEAAAVPEDAAVVAPAEAAG